MGTQRGGVTHVDLISEKYLIYPVLKHYRG